MEVFRWAGNTFRSFRNQETSIESLLVANNSADQEAETIIPHGGLRVTFTDLVYLLPSKTKRGKMAEVLKKMSGFLNAEAMTAVMGPSGCGKSMLMDVLSGRRALGIVHGDILYAAQKPSQAFLRASTGYVEQFNSLIENLTVFEMLMYTAELKRSASGSWTRNQQGVDELIHRLALTSCRDIKIGDPHLDRGISGGQAKRVNIGIALIANPKILFMDEPISGLDSYTANEVMEVVKTLVDDGMTVCATLHSPTPFTFGLFDHILLLLEGQMVFFGNHRDVSSYFMGLAVQHFHPNESVAEWLTGIIVKADQDQDSFKLVQAYSASQLKTKNEASICEFNNEPSNIDLNHFIQHSGSSKENSVWLSIKILLLVPLLSSLDLLSLIFCFQYRSLKNYSTLAFWIARTVDKSVLVVLMATMYHGIGNDFSVSNQLNISSLLFIWTGFSATGALVYVPKMVVERWVFYREQRDGLYPVFSYFLVKVVEEYLVAAILSLFFCSIVWLATDLQGSFARFVFTFFGMYCSSIVLALFFGAIAPNMDVANALFPCYVITQMFYAGYLLRPQDIPSYLVWFSKIDFLKYSYSAYMVNHFRSKSDPQDPSTALSNAYLRNVGLSSVNLSDYVGTMYIFACVFGFFAYLAMHFVRYERKT